MYELVQRFREQVDDDSAKINEIEDEDHDSNDDDEDDDEISLEHRFKGIDLNDGTDQTSDIWSRLTEREKEEFLEMINKGDISEIILPWSPWWLSKSTKPAITEVGLDEADHIPAISNIGVPVQQLTKKVHPSVIFQIIHVSIAYVYMMRHTNGEPRGENLISAYKDMVKVAPLLISKTAEVHQSTQEVLATAFCNIDIELPAQTKIALLSDMTAIFGTPRFVAAMMSDVYSLATEALSDPERLKTSGLKKSVVKNTERRVYFLLSVVLQMLSDTTAWEFITADIAMVKRRFESEELTLPLSAYSMVWLSGIWNSTFHLGGIGCNNDCIFSNPVNLFWAVEMGTNSMRDAIP
ncbi:Zinc finger HIT domain-containing protein 2 [Coemansia interrupta]|uniref:Zinc finger HIT domain-containing protein 2 n=1 Tax=Coemansia interrupta TaxID=1126814 RepID=A0A9W8HQB8_9FUNG|nr:Zinc finger HIT domain-containing protein 2 [Coemansia interrupta]